MKHLEKKYLVSSFATIQKNLTEKGAKKIQKIVSVHYYGQHEGNDVEKFVEYANRCEIHILKETNGQFTLTEHAPVADINTGLMWLKNRGYSTVNIIKMASTDYEYENGLVGLYVIDNFLHSVILDFPKGRHEGIEKEFGLQNTEVIHVPFDKYLKHLGRLRSMKL